MEQGVSHRWRKATEAGTSTWADLWRGVWREIDGWGGLGNSLSVRKVKAHTALEAVGDWVISGEDWAGNDLADAACKLVVLEHRAPQRIRAARHSPNLAVTSMAHWISRIGSARQRRDIDDDWHPWLGRALAVRRERARPWPLPLPARPTVWSRGHTFADTASGRVCALCQRPELSARGGCSSTAGSRARGAAQQIRLDGSTGDTLVLAWRQGGLSAVRRVWFVRWARCASLSAQHVPWHTDSWKTTCSA